MGHRRSLVRVLLRFAAGYLLACAVLGIPLAEISVRLHRLPLEDVAEHRARLEREFHAPLEDVSIAAADGAVLRAWFMQPARANGRSVIVLHGVGANRVDSTGYAETFLAQGYAVLLPDSRDHGESGGAIATYGVLERYDVGGWARWLRGRVPGCTYLLGESMGAAVGLQAEPVVPELCAVAVEDPFARFREITYERLGRGSGTGPLFWKTLGRPILESAVLYTWVRYGVYLPDADPEAALARSHTPTLLITGTADLEIPMHHAQELEAACAGHCELWVVAGAGHCGASTVAHAEFERRVLGFFAAHRE